MKPLGLSQFRQYHSLSSVQWSPDGKRIAFIDKYIDDQDNYASLLYLYEPDAGKFKECQSLGNVQSFLWINSNDILFSSGQKDAKGEKTDDSQGTVFRTFSTDLGKITDEFVIPLKVMEIQPAGGGKYVIRARLEAASSDSDMINKGREQTGAAFHSDSIQVIDELPWWSNGVGFTNKKRSRLFLCDPYANEFTAITDPLFQVNGYQVSSGGEKIVYFGFDFEHKEKVKVGLYLYDLSTKKQTAFFLDDFSIIAADFIDRNTILFAGSDQIAHGFYTNPWFYKVDIPSEKVSLLAKFDQNVGNMVLSDCRTGTGKTIKAFQGELFFTSVTKNDTFLFKIGVDGKIIPLIQESGSVDCFDVSEQGIAFIGLMGQRLQELYISDIHGNKTQRRSDWNERIYQEYYIQKPEHLSFTDKEGFTIDGWVIHPFQHHPGRKYPAILYIHGGPKGANGTVFFNDFQYLAGQGYFVLYCNPRGSEGKGNAFARVRGHYGEYDYENIMQFLDESLRNYPSIDAERLGIMGGSYGGFMVNWAICHTDRFKVAISERSVSNWISFIGLSDIGHSYGEDQMDATVWSDPEKIWKHSPLKYADQARTPTLFIHSDQDYRCNIAEGYQMFAALQRFGVESRMCIFQGENHDLSRTGKPTHRERRLLEITRWLSDKLK